MDPELLNDDVELLNPPVKKFDINLTGDGGRNDFDLSPSTCRCIDRKVFAKYEMKGPVNTGVL